MLLSVIIPLYNNVLYIQDCIDSLYRQGIDDSDFEIIIIDDGSTDGGGEFADKIAAKYVNISVFHQANQGTGEARNTGLSKAQGEYLHFVDPDDFMFDNSYRYIIDELLTKDPDIIWFSYVKDGILGNAYQWGEIAYQGKSKDYYATHGMRVNLPFKWYKRSFVQKHAIAFPSISYSEDNVFTWDSLRYESTLIISHAKLYSYRTHASSSVQNRAVNHVKRTINDLIVANHKLKEFSIEYIDCPAVKSNFMHKYLVLFNRILCMPYSHKEIIDIFSQCAEIGIEHLNKTDELKWIDKIYHHPTKYYYTQVFVLIRYFCKNWINAQSGDFIDRRLTANKISQRIIVLSYRPWVFLYSLLYRVLNKIRIIIN